MIDLGNCRYDSAHYFEVPAVGIIESPISGNVPACQECIDYFEDSLCDGCSMPDAWCECADEEEEE